MLPIFTLVEGDGPLVATAIHAGHGVRPALRDRLALTPAERLREEDPFTGCLTEVAPSRAIGHRSRFEVDLNRPHEGAVYREPEDAWGLTVWKEPLSEEEVEDSLGGYDAFHHAVGGVLERKVERHGGFVLYDLHSYRHRRDGPDAAPADPATHPEVNLGTGSVDRDRWGAVVEAFRETLGQQEVEGIETPRHRLDVRENVKFQGGHFPRWVNATFAPHGCALAVEFRKDFMDEWTGLGDPVHLRHLIEALRATVEPVLAALEA